jgi:microcystin-dependent protein
VSEPFLGEIRLFGFNFAPTGWAMCNGQILPINQNTALFSLLGTQYGGNGTSTFALPDLRSRVPLHQGQGAGLSSYVMGETIGSESVTLAAAQMPVHSHNVQASNAKATTKNPSAAVPGHPPDDTYDAAPDGTLMDASMIAPAGGNQPHENRQPLLVVNFCIALQGIFPSRN